MGGNRSNDYGQVDPPKKWSMIASDRTKPPDEIPGKSPLRRYTAQKFIPTSLMEIVTGGGPQKKKITMGGTPFKLGCHLKNIDGELEEISMGIIIQIPDIQMC
ncbi:hypothetical protein AYI68_g3622 [Smittium mucronatum]|uniref:Uncharacterized protein n=1 Tax=Smittium mucronatum TaxID=133383 RepID=A0A1R0GZC2_9FUNG|nr:hypothetical protein AYI68_g5442 [Smittium mucronatum]OLY82254.1 hypothetical protein AYI68_g3622 [Smittium mucronatum]